MQKTTHQKREGYVNIGVSFVGLVQEENYARLGGSEQLFGVTDNTNCLDQASSRMPRMTSLVPGFLVPVQRLKLMFAW